MFALAKYLDELNWRGVDLSELMDDLMEIDDITEIFNKLIKMNEAINQ